jgi:hypothetical protein
MFHLVGTGCFFFKKKLYLNNFLKFFIYEIGTLKLLKKNINLIFF